MSVKRRRGQPESGRYSEGVASYRGGSYEEAVRLLEPLRGSAGMLGTMANYYQSMARRALGVEALRAGRFQEAEDHFRRAASAIGRSADLTSYLAALYAMEKRYDRCAAEMSRAVDCDARNASAWRGLAQAQWRAGRRDEARMTLRSALRKLGDLAELHLQMGLFAASEERFDEAAAALRRAVEADGTYAEAHYYLALTSSARGQVVEAVRSFQRAFELRRSDLVVAYQLSMAAAAARQAGYPVILRLPEANGTAGESEVRQLAAYVAAEPEFLDACLSLPAGAADGELFGMLAGVVQMAIDAHGRYADLRYYCSRIFDRIGRLDDAIAQAEAAVEINPGYVAALVHLADCRARKGDLAGACDLIDRSIAAGADWPDVHCRAGEIMASLGRAPEARGHFARALELNRGYSRAAEAMSRLAA